ncbi:MAG TPA: hypothetical protein VFN38_09045, partial [Gemmatimonadaceae bacterium]|nr:hypothetical protein [Gemmatimonadaceae bacterium]
MRSSLSFTLVALTLVAATTPAVAQRRSFDDDAEWLANCRSGNWYGDADRGRACEVRPVAVQLSGRSLEVDGRK